MKDNPNPFLYTHLGDTSKETDACSTVGQALHLKEVLRAVFIAYGRAFDPHQMREG